MISKPIKGLPRKAALDLEEPVPGFFGRILQIIVNSWKEYIYYPIDSFIHRTYGRASRSLAFAKHGWMHYDFESAYLYDLMAFKMKRIYKCLETGHAIQDDEDMAALKEAIEICERLFKGEYDRKYYDLHDAKWGEMESDHIPEYREDGSIKWYRWETSRPNAKTEEQKAEEVADLRKIWEYEERDRRADLDRLNEILKKHEPTWWD
ncbi:MAG: hypothetical protein HC840_00615 [Leptolyngbyaceae cyanobacterium RM2_2_4]|nr:hypothetical protein [Leptolyngbyaceae cyanobacterium RM2_2_4]